MPRQLSSRDVQFLNSLKAQGVPAPDAFARLDKVQDQAAGEIAESAAGLPELSPAGQDRFDALDLSQQLTVARGRKRAAGRVVELQAEQKAVAEEKGFFAQFLEDLNKAIAQTPEEKQAGIEKFGEAVPGIKAAAEAGVGVLEKVEAVKEKPLGERLAEVPAATVEAGRAATRAVGAITAPAVGLTAAGRARGAIVKFAPKLFETASQKIFGSGFLKSIQTFGAKAVLGATEGAAFEQAFTPAKEGRPATLKETATIAGISAVAEAVFIPAIFAGAGKFRRAIFPVREEVQADVDKIVGQIIQGEKKDIPKAASALRTLDTKGVESAEQLNKISQEKIAALAKKQDEIFDQNPAKNKLSSFGQTTTVGKTTVKRNFVEDALNNLEELYKKTNDPEKLAGIQEAIRIAKKEGLNAKEVNAIARQYGSEFNAFSRVSGEQLTSVSKEAYEVTRSGVKNTARNLIDDPVAKELDTAMTEIFSLQRNVSKLAKSANAARQKLKERGILEKLSDQAANIFDAFGGRIISGFARRLLQAKGGGSLNAAELDALFKTRLPQLENLFKKLDKLDDAAAVKEVDKVMKAIFPEELPIGEARTPKASVGSKTLGERLQSPETSPLAQKPPLTKGAIPKTNLETNIDKFSKDVLGRSQEKFNVPNRQFHGTFAGNKENLISSIKSGDVKVTKDGLLGDGFYTAFDKEFAESFTTRRAALRGQKTPKTPEVVEIDLSGLKIKMIDMKSGDFQTMLSELELTGKQFGEQLKRAGFDGVSLRGTGETVIFDPKKVKLK